MPSLRLHTVGFMSVATYTSTKQILATFQGLFFEAALKSPRSPSDHLLANLKPRLFHSQGHMPLKEFRSSTP